MRPQRIEPQPGQESVWDYPRPPALDDCPKRIQIIFNDVVIVDTQGAKRILETSHPPTYYLPPDDVQMQYLQPTPRSSFCEWKGAAQYFTLTVGDRRVENVAWCYPNPTPEFADLQNYLAFYCAPMDRCLVGEEIAQPQPGGFYGGWVTSDVVGPFKGEPGTWGW